MTDNEREEAYEAVQKFLDAVKDLRSEMLDEKLTDQQMDYIADYLHDNFKWY